MRFRRIILGCIFCMIGVSAFAADLPKKAVPLVSATIPIDPWTGPYIGIHAGYGFNDANVSAFSPPTLLDLASSPQGFLGGVHAGLGGRFMTMFYAGFEADFDLANVSGSASAPGIITASTRDDLFGTARFRLGVIPFPSVMVYGTAGLAYGDPSASFTINNGTFNSSAFKIGWAVGGGVEYVLTPDARWVGRLEYMRVDLGSVSVNGGGTVPVTLNAATQIDTVRAGLSYKF